MKQGLDILIRQERQEDYHQIRKLVREAFALAEHSDGDEHNLIERIRHSPDYIPELSLVAVSGDIVLGHIIIIAKTKRAKVGVTNTNLVHKLNAV